MDFASEDDLTAWLATFASPRIGDDTVTLPAATYVATVDSQIAGVHFPTGLAARLVARRLAAVNLSDVAAAGARPRFALLSLLSPPNYPRRSFLAALVTSLRRYGVELVGGDLARADRLIATLTLLATPENGHPPPGRGAAQPGDRLWVGGTLGESALGQRLLERQGGLGRRGHPHRESDPDLPPALAAASRRAIQRHLAPRPQLALGSWLARQPRAAVLDISDGLARDLSRLCRRSQVGATLDAAALPIPGDTRQLASRLGWDALELALGGGEDYVLLFTLPADRQPPARFGAIAIGETTSTRALALRLPDGTVTPLRPTGWDHLQAD